MTSDPIHGELGEFILYQTEDGQATVQMRAVGGTVWLTQAQIAALFGTTPQNISQHLRTVYGDGEVVKEATCKKFLHVAAEGSRSVQRNTLYYSLEAVLAVGYRIKSHRGVQFRQWATTTLKEYLVKGFVMDDARLKDGRGYDYFDELLERIRDIRASEKRFYQKITDIFSTAVDYDSASQIARDFFASAQNKVIYAVTGQTAAELIIARSNPEEPNMGLTSWGGDRVRKKDVTVAKNYLTQSEISELNRLTTMLLDFAEDRARARREITMAQWAEHVDRFLVFNEREVLSGPGRISHASMEKQVQSRYDSFSAARRKAEDRVAEATHMHELEMLHKKLRSEQPPERLISLDRPEESPHA